VYTLCIGQGSCQHVTICIHHTHSSCIHCDTLSVKADTLYPGMVGILRVPTPTDSVPITHSLPFPHTHCPYHASYLLLASCWLSARESVANRDRAVAVWGIALSIGYAVCPSMPQSPSIMALHLVAISLGDAANGGTLRGLAWHHACILS